MKKLENKTVLITGAASGMGKAMVELFAKEGAHVILVDLHQNKLDEMAKELNSHGGSVLPKACDVSNLKQVKNLLARVKKQFGNLDILINNAGIMDDFTPLDRVSNELWEKVMGVNLNGPFFMTRESIVLMLEKESGVIINIASVGGLQGARAGLVYTTSKHALIGMSKNIAFMYAKKGIRCNVIAPGGVNTNIMKEAAPDPEGAEICSSGAAFVPRMGEPEEIARAALFLACDDSSFANGAILTLDGGWTAY